jgi:anti-repressor protein
MSELVPFNFDGNQVRVIVDLEGNPWWVAADVCAILEITNVSDAVSRLDPLDVGSADVQTARGQIRPMKMVNESGLWDLILDSRKPEAKRFRRWVTSEVLPAIRSTGSYAAVPKSFAEALELAAAKQREIENAEARLAIAEPKAEFHTRFMESGGLSSMTDLADMFGTSVGKFTGWLADLGIFRKGEYAQFPGRRMPRKTYIDGEMFTVKIERSALGITYPVAYATPKGLEFVRGVLRDNGLVD